MVKCFKLTYNQDTHMVEIDRHIVRVPDNLYKQVCLPRLDTFVSDWNNNQVSWYGPVKNLDNVFRSIGERIVYLHYVYYNYIYWLRKGKLQIDETMREKMQNYYKFIENGDYATFIGKDATVKIAQDIYDLFVVNK